MLRKKKRQSEREADAVAATPADMNNNNGAPAEDTEGSRKRRRLEEGETSNGQIDLNCHPDREDMEVDEAAAAGPSTSTSMNGHFEAPNNPLVEFMNQNGSTEESNQSFLSNRKSFPSVVWARERRDGDVCCDPNSNDKTRKNNPS